MRNAHAHHRFRYARCARSPLSTECMRRWKSQGIGDGAFSQRGVRPVWHPWTIHIGVITVQLFKYANTYHSLCSVNHVNPWVGVHAVR